MRALEQAITQMGSGIGTDIVKVDSFLNHRIDTALMLDMGREIADRYRDAAPDLVLTIEASGIALALATAQALDNIPVVFAKKSVAVTQSSDIAQEQVFSFTRKTTYTIRVDLRYLPTGARVLIVDDFLADGAAVRGLKALVERAGAQVVGVGIAIEKGFQQGGQKLRALNIPLYSLAVVDEIRDGNILFRAAE